MEIELNGAKLRVYEDGKIERFGFKRNTSKEQTWYELKDCVRIYKSGYKRNLTSINYKSYTTSRVIYFAFNPTWDITDSSSNNTIDHINRDSLDNRLSNLRVANSTEQLNNRDCIINAKGYTWHKSMNKWHSYININKKRIHLGYFETEKEASKAYQDAKAKN